MCNQTGSVIRKRLMRYCLSISFALLGGVSSGHAETTYTVGIVPQFEARKLVTIWAPILTELEKRTGFTLKMVGPSNFSAFQTNYLAGQYDFVYMNPYFVVIPGQKYIPLVREGSSQLYGIVVVAKDSPFQELKELAGKRIAYTAPNAMAASMMVRAELDKQKIKTTPIWTDTHTSAYLQVVLGKADAAGGVMHTLKQQSAAVQDKLRIIYETRRTPAHPFSANKKIAKADQEKMRQAFIELAETPEGAALIAKIPMANVVPASYEDYKPLRSLGLEKYYVKED